MSKVLCSSERGSVTIMMVALLSVATFIVVGLSSIGHAYDTKSRAQAVTDIAAIYAAELVWNQNVSASEACERAKQYAREHDVQIQQCSMVDETVQLTTQGELGWGVAKHSSFEVSARAGPVPLDVG